MDVVKRNLDLMAAVKLNVLHLHLTEDQGFRIESKRYPSLHEKGSDGNYFTQAEMKGLIAYAAERGIRVVPEFDIPGHSTSWLVGHPELGSAPGPYSIERTWGIMEPALDPTREEVYKLLDGFLGEMAALFPDAYLHIGGDENKGKQWMAERNRITALHEAARPRRRARAAGLLQPAAAGDRAEARQEDDRLGRGAPSRPPEGRRRAVVARAEVARRSGEAGLLRDSVERLLHRSELPDLATLRRRPAARLAEPDARGSRSRAGRRGVHVVRVRRSRQHRLAAVAPPGGHRGALLVAEDGHGRGRRVSADGAVLAVAGDRREPAHHRPGHSRAEPRERRRRRGGGHAHQPHRAGQGIQAGRPSQEHAILAADAASRTRRSPRASRRVV